MAHEKKATSSTAGVEWRINVGDGSSKILVQEAVLATRAWLGLKGLVFKVRKFWEKAYDVGVNDPRKVVHCLKVGTALTVVSLFYYLRPLYEGFGGNAMWAIMTVVVVFENTVGATIYKSLNRVSGTSLAGLLAFSVHWVACKSGEKFEPLLVGASVFLLASAATFSRFIPSVKQNFDYGAMIFILTFSLVAVSGYRVEKLFELAHERLSTIIIGISSCFLVSMLICPIWAGQELYALVTSNMEKLANSLDCCVAEYFSPDDSNKNLLAYKCVLSSKASEESMANFARWEPPHGCFSFKHPWKQYPKIGAAMRNCAYCIEALSSCIDSETQAPEFIKKQLSTACQRVSSNSSSVITELAETIKSMKRSCNIDFLVEEMNSAVEELQQALKSLSKLSIPPESKNITETPTSAAMDTKVPLMEVMPVVTFASLLIEISSRIKGIVKAVEQLANVAEFKVTVQDKCNETQRNNKLQGQQKDEETMKVRQWF
ncbi:hypothetical protein P3X46_016870 [Hevea brasiliensis]|uniref:Aluminum-activated malate transporter n=1 Tax=Hevea brasiliensis TaxID=3981 RepID=A0ABQ9M0G4_HEVBR|nr:aluminum-activated malate transporter 10-like [Hevea brasiliensis]KAJ9173764.1 hypothetical protein P3X46_016870 [Hevea brasiliensis]